MRVRAGGGFWGAQSTFWVRDRGQPSRCLAAGDHATDRAPRRVECCGVFPVRRCGDESRCSAIGRLTAPDRSEEHTSELQSLMRISYAVFCLKKKKIIHSTHNQ